MTIMREGGREGGGEGRREGGGEGKEGGRGGGEGGREGGREGVSNSRSTGGCKQLVVNQHRNKPREKSSQPNGLQA